MWASSLAQWEYISALQMDYRTATLLQRITSSGPIGTADTFNTYNVTRTTYRPPRFDELQLVNASLADGLAVWTLYIADPGLVGVGGSPIVPGKEWLLDVVNNGNWTIETITNSDLQVKYDCLCRTQKTNKPK